MSEPTVMTMARRSVRLSSRSPDAVITSLLLPVLIMLAFVYLFGGAIEGTTGFDAYVDFVLPGVLVQCSGIVSSLTAMSVATDLREGVIQRFRSMDVSPVSMLGGHVIAGLGRNLAALVLATAVAVLIGFDPVTSPPRVLAAIALVSLFAFALSWFCAAFGLMTRTPEGAAGIQFAVIFLPYASSGFVPLDTFPSWLHGFAEHQPVTPVIDAMRALLLDVPIGHSAWYAVAWCVGIAVVSMVLSGMLFRRRTR